MSSKFAVLAAGIVCASVMALSSPAKAQLSSPSPEASRAAKERLAKEPDLFRQVDKLPDVSGMTYFSEIKKNGGQYFSMGERSGLHGWLVVIGGRMQMAYTTSDLKSVMLGSLFTAGGSNVTGVQMIQLIEGNKEVAGLLDEALKQHQTKPFAAAPRPTDAMEGSSVVTKTETAAAAAAPLSPGDQLIADLQGATGVLVGKGNGPEITMIFDTQCPNCKEAWKMLRDPVMAGKVRIRLIPANDQTPEGINAAASLLKSPDPLTAWDKFALGNKAALSGEADMTDLNALQKNRQILDKWKIQVVPYIVYRAKDGKAKVVVGKPKETAALLADLP